MKITIVDIKHYDTDREGNQLINRNNKPYTRCNLKDKDGWISGFGNLTTRQWKVGDEVEVDITMNGQYRNFTIKPRTVSREEFDELFKKVKWLLEEVEVIHDKVFGEKGKEEEEPLIGDADYKDNPV